MDRADLAELHFIAHVSNLASIAAHGILCFDAARKLPHTSVAMNAVQQIRSKVQVPHGLKLHSYANLYFHARNPMMYLRKNIHDQLCILCIDPAVLDLNGVVIADGNASSDYTGFWPSPQGLAKVDRDLAFAEDWRDSDQITYWQKKRVKCAEVLVPTAVPVQLIKRIYVSSNGSKSAVQASGAPWPVLMNAHLFFRD